MSGYVKSISSMLLSSVLFSGAVLAADRGDSLAVKYGDLNMTSQAGITDLYRRIHSAALAVCHDSDVTRHVGPERAQVDACVKIAEDGAVRNVNSSSLSALHQAKTGRAVTLVAANINR